MPLGVLLHNENVNHEMCKILDCLHEYVPSTAVASEVTLDDGEIMTHVDYKLIQQLLGGDQLTVARVHSAQGIRENHEDSISALRGIIPVVEDWHTRLTLMQVCITDILVTVFIMPSILAILNFSLFGVTSTTKSRHWIGAHCLS